MGRFKMSPDTFKLPSNFQTFRQPSSLLSNNNRYDIKGITKCGDSLRKCCENIIECREVSFKVDDVTTIFNLKNNFNSHSHNLIYKMMCNGCEEYCIGKTGDSLKHRMTVHRQQINNINYSPLRVSKHIRTCARDIDIKFRVAPFYKMSPSSTKLDRKKKRRNAHN
jgi:hypothetical protein